MKNIVIASTLFLLAFTFTSSTASADMQRCGDTEVDIKGNSAGLIYHPTPILITDQNLNSINTEEGCAVVSWSTDTLATSQVVFAEIDAEVSINITEENLGFTNSTIQNNAANTEHTAIIDGLEAGKTYVYRVLSRSHPASMPTVSDSYTLTASGTFTPVLSVWQESVQDYTYAPPIQPVISSVIPIIVPQTLSVPVVNEEYVPISTKVTESTIENAPTSSDVSILPAAINSVSNIIDFDIDSGALASWASSFTSRIKQAFFLKSDFISRVGFIVPTIFLLLAVWLLQKVFLPMIGMVIKRKILFWILSLSVLVAATALLKYYKITLIIVALLLTLTAWHLFKQVDKQQSTTQQPTS